MMQSDQDLIGQIKNAMSPCLKRFLHATEISFVSHVARTVRDDSTAEDLVQEAFLRVWTCAAQWNGRGEFKAWFFRIATNLAFNHLRTVRRRRQQPLEIPPDEIDAEEKSLSSPDWMIDTSSLGPDAQLEKAERHELLWQLVDGLPKDKRQVLHLVYEADLDLQETAATLGIPEGTVKSRPHYTMKRLAREWKEIAIEWGKI